MPFRPAVLTFTKLMLFYLTRFLCAWQAQDPSQKPETCQERKKYLNSFLSHYYTILVFAKKTAAKNAISGRFPRSPLPWGRNFIEIRRLKSISEVS